jgi:hypothetical protein
MQFPHTYNQELVIYANTQAQALQSVACAFSTAASKSNVGCALQLTGLTALDLSLYLQSTQGLAPNRVHVWQLTANVSIGVRGCTFTPSLNVTGTTTLIGDIASTTNAPQRDVPSMRYYPLGTALPSPNARTAVAAAKSALASTAAADAVRFGQLYSLAFQYTPGLIHIPAGAPDRHFNIQNITLSQLPQASSTASSAAERGAGRRLTQGVASGAIASMAPLTTHIPPGSMTILLWPFNRCVSNCFCPHAATMSPSCDNHRLSVTLSCSCPAALQYAAHSKSRAARL